MARYQYAGPGPIETLLPGRIVRPGDVREFDAAPDWGPWDLLDGPDSAPAAAPPAEPEQPDPAPQWPATPPATPEGNK